MKKIFLFFTIFICLELLICSPVLSWGWGSCDSYYRTGYYSTYGYRSPYYRYYSSSYRPYYGYSGYYGTGCGSYYSGYGITSGTGGYYGGYGGYYGGYGCDW